MSQGSSPATPSKTSGYSKSIIRAINEGNSSFEKNQRSKTSPASCAETSSASIPTEVDNKTVPEAGPVEITLKTQKNVPAAVRERKSLSCDLGEAATFSGECVGTIQDSKKSQSLRQVNQASETPKRSESGRTTTRTASTISGSSKSSKVKDFIEIPFKLCADALYACATGNLARIKELLKEEPNLMNYAYPHCFRLTCLHVAARAGDLPLVRYLVEKGANMNARDDNLQTPMHFAAMSNKYNVLQLLRSFKADEDIVDAWGLRPHDYLNKDSKMEHSSSKTLSLLGSSINSTIAGISGFGGATAASIAASNSTPYAEVSCGNLSVSSMNGTFQRIGSLRPLRRHVNKVRDLFN